MMVIPEPPAIVFAVNVSVSTFEASSGVLMEAPVVAVTDAVTSDGEPVSVMRSLPLTGTAVAGVTTIFIEAPVPPARTSDRVITGPVMLPSTIAGKVPAALVPRLTPTEVVTADATFDSAACAALGVVNPLTVNIMSVFALNVPAVSVTVITVPPNTAALALAPVAGDENTTLQPLQPSPAPLRLTIKFPLGGVMYVGVSDTVNVFPVVAFITLLRATVNAWDWTGWSIPNRVAAMKIIEV